MRPVISDSAVEERYALPPSDNASNELDAQIAKPALAPTLREKSEGQINGAPAYSDSCKPFFHQKIKKPSALTNNAIGSAAQAETLVHTYFRAKDQNRPHLMAQVFAPEARLEMTVKTGAISFPAITDGLASITNVLVRKFGQTYENVYSFCLKRPTPSDRSSFSCDWLVGMSGKEGGQVRMGCGRYDWHFQSEAPYLVDRLHITIEAMQILPGENLESLMTWLADLPYPWSDRSMVVETMPRIPGLEPVIDYLTRS